MYTPIVIYIIATINRELLLIQLSFPSISCGYHEPLLKRWVQHPPHLPIPISIEILQNEGMTRMGPRCHPLADTIWQVEIECACQKQWLQVGQKLWTVQCHEQIALYPKVGKI